MPLIKHTFSQERIGRESCPFPIYKFRTLDRPSAPGYAWQTCDRLESGRLLLWEMGSVAVCAVDADPSGESPAR
ncbi:MAG: sugar transferase [Candidatus Nealsonbacteria bacterium]|nr:sugar transferase [Candidatus Nealsonbacteria bacterium]